MELDKEIADKRGGYRIMFIIGISACIAFMASILKSRKRHDGAKQRNNS